MTRWIHGISKELLRATFRDYFGVSDEHADIVVILYGRPGEWVTTRKMQALLNSHRPPKRSAVHERIRVLREIMEPESLISGGQLSDLGYTLTEVGFSECQKALHAMADVLTRLGPVHGIESLEIAAAEHVASQSESPSLRTPLAKAS